jgi:2-methylcitrate dehydratase PrpD
MNETETLARFVAGARRNDIPRAIRHEGRRALLNWLGCALGGCRDETVERALQAVAPFVGVPGASLVGRSERADPLNAALVNALSSNILDYDDTHMPTVIHPTVPVAAAACAVAEHRGASGAALLDAFILGVEVECRVGNAMSPGHYAAGWHITSTCGVIGAAAAVAKLLELDAQRMTWALGIAATQSCGLTAMMGSMSKSYNMGHAAKSGVLAALLAERGFTSSERALEAPRGFANVLARNPRLNALTDELGSAWALSCNAYKPFPCGIVLHAAIDGCMELRDEHALTPDAIERAEARLHPLALELAGKAAPRTGLEGKLSVYHAAAVALLYGRAGVAEFTDECVGRTAVQAFSTRVVAIPDATLDKAAARVRIVLKDGRILDRYVPYALGSLEKPMKDRDLEDKFRALAACTSCDAEQLIRLVWSLDELENASTLTRAASLPHPNRSSEGRRAASLSRERIEDEGHTQGER